jgi:hypothetical protein
MRMPDIKIYCLPLVDDLASIHGLLDSLFTLNHQLVFIDMDGLGRLHEAGGLLLILDHAGFDRLASRTNREAARLQEAMDALILPSYPLYTLLLDFSDIPDTSRLPRCVQQGQIMLYGQPDVYELGTFSRDRQVDILDIGDDDLVSINVSETAKPEADLDLEEADRRFGNARPDSKLVFPQGGVIQGATRNSKLRLAQNDFGDLFEPVFEQGMAEATMGPDEGRDGSAPPRVDELDELYLDATAPNEGADDTEPPRVEELEEVYLGASAPKSVAPGSEYTARFAAYVESEKGRAEEQLSKGAKEKAVDLAAASCRWKTGVNVRVRLRGTDMIVDEPEQTFVWSGAFNDLLFDVSVAEDAEPREIVLKFDIFIDELRQARIRLDMTIGNSVSAHYREATATPIKQAFASYASRDRQRVLDRVSAMKINSGIDIFQDCLSLHPDEEWKPRLENEIRKRDLFILFWSRHAKESPWVAWELQTAYEKDPDSIQVQPLDPVDLAMPPQKLASRHFNDPAMIIWFYEEFLKNRPPAKTH